MAATFGGNPLAATVANAVLAHLDAPLLAGVGERHALIVDQLNAISARYDAFSAVRGTGLLIGAELAGRCAARAKTLTNLAAEEGLISPDCRPGRAALRAGAQYPAGGILRKPSCALDQRRCPLNPLTGRTACDASFVPYGKTISTTSSASPRARGRHDLLTA